MKRRVERRGEERGVQHSLLPLDESHAREHDVEVHLEDLECLNQVVVLDDELGLDPRELHLTGAGTGGMTRRARNGRHQLRTSANKWCENALDCERKNGQENVTRVHTHSHLRWAILHSEI